MVGKVWLRYIEGKLIRCITAKIFWEGDPHQGCLSDVDTVLSTLLILTDQGAGGRREKGSATFINEPRRAQWIPQRSRPKSRAFSRLKWDFEVEGEKRKKKIEANELHGIESFFGAS
jgi:hypothetical protein